MSKRIYAECPQGVCKVSETVHDTVREVSAGVRETVHGRPWTWKAARNCRNNRTVPAWKQVTTLSALVMALVSTLTEKEPKTQVIVYLVFGTVFFLFDPINCLTRLLAPQSCCLIALDQMLVIVGIVRPMRGYLIVMVVLITGSLTAIRFLNYEWLAGYNWKMSEAVQKSLLVDVENKATKAWQAHGRREIRTLLHELGYQANDSILDILHRPVYLCGFLNGYEKTTKYKSRLESLENKADKYLQVSKDMKAENQKLRNEVSSMKQAEDELRAQLSETEYMYRNIQQMYAESQDENRRLRVANEELLLGIPEPAEISEEQTEEAQISRLLNQGMSIRKVAEILQIPKCRVERVKQKNASDSDIVVIGAVQ